LARAGFCVAGVRLVFNGISALLGFGKVGGGKLFALVSAEFRNIKRAYLSIIEFGTPTLLIAPCVSAPYAGNLLHAASLKVSLVRRILLDVCRITLFRGIRRFGMFQGLILCLRGIGAGVIFVAICGRDWWHVRTHLIISRFNGKSTVVRSASIESETTYAHCLGSSRRTPD
jgi:hypothetical protein